MDMTIQELFDKIANHLKSMTKQSTIVGIEGEQICAYRSLTGDRCAAGCLIADEYYEPSLETRAASTPAVIDAIERSIGRELSSEEAIMIRMMQKIHDDERAFNDTGLSFWARTELKEAARVRGLEYQV